MGGDSLATRLKYCSQRGNISFIDYHIGLNISVLWDEHQLHCYGDMAEKILSTFYLNRAFPYSINAMLPNIMVISSNYTHYRFDIQEWYKCNNSIFIDVKVLAVFIDEFLVHTIFI